MNGKDFIKAEADGKKILCVCGMKVYAPLCPVCHNTEHIIVKEDENGWVYHCEACSRDLTYDDVIRGE